MMQLLRIVSMVVMITGCLLLGSVLGEEKVLPHKVFPTVKDVAKALGTAYETGDRKAVARILGD